MRIFSVLLAMASMLAVGMFCNSAKAGRIVSFGGTGGNDAIANNLGDTDIEAGPWPGSTTDIVTGAWDPGELDGLNSGSQTLDDLKITITAPTDHTIKADTNLTLNNPDPHTDDADHGLVSFTVSFDQDVYLLGWHLWAGASGKGVTLTSTGFVTASAATFNRYTDSSRTAIPTHANVAGTISTTQQKNDTIYTNDRTLLLTAGTEFTIVAVNGSTSSLEHITVEKVPEPSSALLASLSLVGLGFIRRRRR